MIDWRKELSTDEKKWINYGVWDYNKKDWMPSASNTDKHIGKVLDIKGYDPIILDKSLKTARAYEYSESDLNEVGDNKTRNERLSPELMIDDLPMIDGKFMLVQNNTYRVYFDRMVILKFGVITDVYQLALTAKALNYGFQIQSTVAIEENFNPVIPFYDDVLGYILSTNLWTPVTVNIPLETKLVYFRRLT